MSKFTFKMNEAIYEIKEVSLINLGRDFASPMIDLKNPTYIY